jgi:3-phenylpropionate/trans-cinnamate dioxygenase ferredoxin reductase component
MEPRAVIVGGGQAGAQCAISLRQNGWPGDIVMLCAEPHLPYQRPPLSKAYLGGETAVEGLSLRDAAFYERERIHVRLGESATAIDRRDRTIVTSEAELVPYDRLFIATGARPRRLDVEGRGLDGVAHVRDVADIDRIRPRFAAARDVVIVGAGYIGLEVAAVAAKAGKRVTVLEAADRALSRVAGPTISAFYARYHVARGVAFRFGSTVDAFLGEDRLLAARLRDGSEIAADVAFIGIGIVPNDEPAMFAGIEVTPGVGIEVDGDMLTSDPAIYAIGDCARAHNPFAAARTRLESVANAIDQAKIAAAHACGLPRPEPAVPWFWSDQYDLKLQTAGIVSAGHDEEVVRGDPASGRFAVFYLRKGSIAAVDAVNAPDAFNFTRRVLAGDDRVVPAGALADPGVELKALLASMRTRS